MGHWQPKIQPLPAVKHSRSGTSPTSFWQNDPKYHRSICEQPLMFQSWGTWVCIHPLWLGAQNQPHLNPMKGASYHLKVGRGGRALAGKHQMNITFHISSLAEASKCLWIIAKLLSMLYLPHLPVLFYFCLFSLMDNLLKVQLKWHNSL